MNTEMISGTVADLRVIPTRSGRNMVVFALEGKSCKAFEDNAANLQTLNGKQVTVAAKRGSYRGEAEYAVERIENPSGAVNHTSGTCPHCGAQMAVRDFYPGLTEETFEEMLRASFGGSVAPELREPANNAVSETPMQSEQARQKLNETMIPPWVKSFSDSFLYPDSDLEKKLTAPHLAAWTREAARRVLETRRIGKRGVKQESANPAEAHTATGPETERELTLEEAEDSVRFDSARNPLG